MERNRERTERALVEAVGSVVMERGFGALGVNAVASRAGVAKVLIYRYFGDFDGLLEEWALRHSYWALQSGEFFSGGLDELSPRAQVKELFRHQIRSLRGDPLKREVLRWMLTTDHPVAGKVMRRVEEQGYRLSEHFIRQIAPRGDAEAMVALLIAGSYYLSLAADRTDVFNGVPLNGEEGWRRIEGAVERYLDAMLGPASEG